MNKLITLLIRALWSVEGIQRSGEQDSKRFGHAALSSIFPFNCVQKNHILLSVLFHVVFLWVLGGSDAYD